MKEKCTKYEALFTFGSDEALKEHVAQCDDCRQEQVVMDKVSNLLKEVKPYYISKRKSFARVKIACAMFAILLSSSTLGVINLNTDISDVIKYGNTLCADDLGLPVDDYGLLMVE